MIRLFVVGIFSSMAGPLSNCRDDTLKTNCLSSVAGNGDVLCYTTGCWKKFVSITASRKFAFLAEKYNNLE